MIRDESVQVADSFFGWLGWSYTGCWLQLFSTGIQIMHPDPTTFPSSSTFHPPMPQCYLNPVYPLISCDPKRHFFPPDCKGSQPNMMQSNTDLNGGMIMIIITEMMMKDVLLWVIQWCHWKTMRSWGGERQMCTSQPVKVRGTRLRAAGKEDLLRELQRGFFLNFYHGTTSWRFISSGMVCGMGKSCWINAHW